MPFELRVQVIRAGPLNVVTTNTRLMATNTHGYYGKRTASTWRCEQGSEFPRN